MTENRRTESEEERRLRRRARIEEMKRQKRRAERLQKCVIPATLVLVLFLVIGLTGLVRGRNTAKKTEQKEQEIQGGTAGLEQTGYTASSTAPVGEYEEQEDSRKEENPGDDRINPLDTPCFSAAADANTGGFSEAVISEYGVMIDVDEGRILAQKERNARISPASMTKILTVLVAAKELQIQGEDWNSLPVLEDKFSITIEITDYSYVHDCSNVGFDVGEEVTVRDLFYGTILPSGADAALGLACYVAGSQEAFVELMNKELEALGMSESTHFTNCIGLYDENHYSTVYDMAVILKTAADNPFCRAVLSAHTYETAATKQHPDGLLLSNWFLRRIEDKDTHGEVLCAKTGFVVQSKNCAASLAKDKDGKEYICVTAGSSSSWKCIYDHVELYQTWLEAE